MKKLLAKVDEYQKDGQTKGKYAEVGVLLENDGGEYILLNAEFCIAGILLKQSQLAYKTNKPQPMNVMLSVFTDVPGTPQAAQQAPKTQQNGGPVVEDDVPY